MIKNQIVKSLAISAAMTAAGAAPLWAAENGAPLTGQVWNLEFRQLVGADNYALATLSLSFGPGGCIAVSVVDAPDGFSLDDPPCSSQFAITGSDTDTPELTDIAFAYQLSYPVWDVYQGFDELVKTDSISVQSANSDETCEGFRTLSLGEQVDVPLCGLPGFNTGNESRLAVTVTRTE